MVGINRSIAQGVILEKGWSREPYPYGPYWYNPIQDFGLETSGIILLGFAVVWGEKNIRSKAMF